MKNEVKLNIHMFFPEMQNDEISAEKYAALEKLINLSPIDAEDSVEKFTSELSSRFELIKQILGDQTEEFLGYKQGDIVKLSNFFESKFVRFGMDAVAVQKILRKIWQQTPCEDKRLNYDLYKFIDEKFYGIVNERKRNISFDHNPVPTDSQWETLKNDWESRRAHYAACLDIDIDYLDSEAVDGTIFPSASGLFAKPSFEGGREIEFLNFWMPYLQKLQEENNRIRVVPSYLTDKNILGIIHSATNQNTNWLSSYINFFKEYNKPSDQTTIYQVNNEIKSILYVGSEKDFYQKMREHYGATPPVHFFFKTFRSQIQGLPSLPAYFSTLSKNEEEIHNIDESHQLPEFINSCREFALKLSKTIGHSRFLRFYKDEKFYFPDNVECSAKFTKYADAYDAAKVELPEFKDGIQAAANYYDNVFLKMDGLEYSPNVWRGNLTVFAREFPEENIFFHRANELYELLKQRVDYYTYDSELPKEYKLRILATIKEYFKHSENLGPNLADYIDQKINEIADKTDVDKQQANGFNLGDQINYFYQLQESEKLKLQAKEAEVRESIFRDNCHTIGNLSRATSGNLDSAKQELEWITPQLQEYQYVFEPLNEAQEDIEVILQHATSISNSYRELDNDWHEDVNVANDGVPFLNIVRQALLRSISSVFYRDVTAFCYAKVSENYFAKRNDMNTARSAFRHLESWESQSEWITNHLFALIWDDSVFNQTNIKIGNNHFIRTHLFTLFYEIFLNAVKAISYSQDRCRELSVTFALTDKGLKVQITNSIGKGIINNTPGGGQLTIENYMKKFSIEDFSSGVSQEKSCFEISFTLPF